MRRRTRVWVARNAVDVRRDWLRRLFAGALFVERSLRRRG
jgi:hypothetical protein